MSDLEITEKEVWNEYRRIVNEDFDISQSKLGINLDEAAFFDAIAEMDEATFYDADFIVRSTRGTLFQAQKVIQNLANGQQTSKNEVQSTLDAINHLQSEIDDYLFSD